MKEKKLLFVVSSLDTGGAQMALANISMALPKGLACDFLINSSQEVVYEHKGDIIDLGFNRYNSKTDLIYMLKVFIKRLIVLSKLKKSGKYTACISALTSANVANILTKTKKCRSIVSIHNHVSSKINNNKAWKGRLEKIAVRTFTRYSDYAVAVSESIRSDLIRNYNASVKNTITIYNGCYPDILKSKSSEALTGEEIKKLRPTGKERLLVNIGRLSTQKGQDRLLRIFKIINQNIPDTRLVIIGDGELKSSLKSLAEELDVADKVVFWGFENNPYRILSKADLLLSTSLFEGFGIVIVESLSLDVPVVSTDCDCGPREILAPLTDIEKKTKNSWEEAEYGILCPPFREGGMDEDISTEELIYSKSVCEILTDNEKYQYYKDKCTQRAKDFDMRNIIHQWIDLL